MSNANIALVQSLYAAFGRGDIGTIVGALTADATWESVGRPSDFPALGLRRGPPAVQQFFELIGQHLDFSEFSPKEFFAADGRVFAIGHYAMTVKKFGRKIDSDWVHVFAIRDGKVVSFREFTDTAQIAEAYRG